MTDNKSELTIEQVEQEIADIYRFWAITAPGRRVMETGRLQVLWKVWDTLFKQDRANDSEGDGAVGDEKEASA